MNGRTDKQRIVAMQKALRIARAALEHYRHDSAVDDALYEINKLDWKTKPSGLQGICGHGENVQ